MLKTATFSNDKKYRYSLERVFDTRLPIIAFIGLNPSIADEEDDDPTVMKLIKYSKNWGYGGFRLVNLFAYISTDPNSLKELEDPIGDENDFHIDQTIQIADKVICCWGEYGNILGRSTNILSLIELPFCLKVNQSGEPSHPLYLSGDLQPIRYKK